jgi:hypothetical protein
MMTERRRRNYKPREETDEQLHHHRRLDSWLSLQIKEDLGHATFSV